MQPKDKNALPAKGRKAQGKAVRSGSFYTRIDYEYHFFAALGLIARRRWTRELRRMVEINKEFFLSEEELLQRSHGFRNNAVGHPNGNFFEQQQDQAGESIAVLSSLIAAAFDRAASLLLMQPPPPPSLPRAAPGICLTPRILAQVPARLLAGR